MQYIIILASFVKFQCQQLPIVLRKTKEDYELL